MGVYIPLKVRLAKASIPQVVAYIQTYLEDNPIPAMDTFAELIAEFLEDHPELVAVASVNAKTGAVILTGADIMLNSDADVTLATEITNLNSMIASLSSQVAQAVTTVGGFETDIEDINSDIDTINVALDTKDTEIYQINQTLTNHLNGINTNTTKNAQQDTRLTALESALDTLETDYNDLNTQVTLHTQQITALQGMIGDSSEILERLTEVEQTAANAQSAVSAMQSTVNTLSSNVSGLQTSVNTLNSDVSDLKTSVNTLNSDVSDLKTSVNNDKIYYTTLRPVSTSTTEIAANSTLDVVLNTENLPSNYTLIGLIPIYCGNPKVVLTHYWGSINVTLYNPSSAAVTYSVTSCTFRALYKITG